MMEAKDTPAATARHRHLLGTGLLALALAGVLAWCLAPGRVSTNDAQIDGHIHPLATRIAGTVVWVNPELDDTHFVKTGTLLARLDPNDYTPAVDRLRGEVDATQAQLTSAKLDVRISEATSQSRLVTAKAAIGEAESDEATAEAQSASAAQAVAQAGAVYRRAEADRERYLALVGTHEISRSEYDQRATDATSAGAQMQAAEANLTGARQHVASAKERIAERRGELLAASTAPEQVATARANVERVSGELRRSMASLKDSTLNLGYTDIVAPIDGVIGRKSIEVGQRIGAGQLLLTLTSTTELWAVANFKETELTHVKVGQNATVHVDATGQELKGRVESLGGATGAKFALLPPENATGNYVKVVQRVPVRIEIANGSPKQLLIPGMSVEVRIDTEH